MHFHRAPGLVGGVAEVFEGTVDALGLAGNAEPASVPDNLVGEENPLFAWDDSHQVSFDFLRVSLRGEFEAARDAVYVGVDDYSFGDLEPRPQDNVRSLAGDAGQGEEVLHVERNLPAEIGDNLLGGADYRF